VLPDFPGWSQTYDLGANDIAYDLDQTADGGFIAAGSRGETKTLDVADFWILKTDSNGDIEGM
jgi:hypothetical protein